MLRTAGEYQSAGAEGAEAEGVVAAADRARVVDVESRRDAGVRLCSEAIRIEDRLGTVLADREVVVLEALQRNAAGVEIELVDQQDVRANTLNRLGRIPGLDVVRRRDVGQELPGRVPVQRGVEGGKADVRVGRTGGRGRREQQRRERGKQESAHPLPPLGVLSGRAYHPRPDE